MAHTGIQLHPRFVRVHFNHIAKKIFVDHALVTFPIGRHVITNLIYEEIRSNDASRMQTATNVAYPVILLVVKPVKPKMRNDGLVV